MLPADFRRTEVPHLEGFLFPATYSFTPKTPTRQLVLMQLDAFSDAWEKVDLKYAESKNLTAYDVLIIASMVEKEVQVARERPLVAAVIYNRLKAEMPLGIDATIRYGFDIPPTEPILESQLESDNPYNSRAIQACRRLRSPTRAWRRSRPPPTPPTSTTSSSSARPTAGAISSRRARASSELPARRAPVRGVDGETRLVGLLGQPVSHSLSPLMQNAAFAARALDWAYVALPVEPARLEDAVAGLVALGFEGANVTIPHKVAVVAFCDELDGVAERAGSVNTLVIREGRVLGSSTRTASRSRGRSRSPAPACSSSAREAVRRP